MATPLTVSGHGVCLAGIASRLARDCSSGSAGRSCLWHTLLQRDAHDICGYKRQPVAVAVSCAARGLGNTFHVSNEPLQHLRLLRQVGHSPRSLLHGLGSFC